MSKPPVWALVGVLVGAGIGVGAMRLLDTRRGGGSAPTSGQAVRADGPGEDADPVVATLHAPAFFGLIASEKATASGYTESGFGLAHYRIGEALWDADPIDEVTLRGRVDAALKAPILAAGARPLSETVSAGVIQNGSHKLHTFVCFYEAKIGGRLQDRQATAWVTVPVQCRQYSACFRFGR